jgi:LCP family protein required for cell wall assembly
VAKAGRTTTGKAKKRSSVPRWAQVSTVFGALLMLLSGGALVTSETLLARYEGAVNQGDLFGDKAAGAEVRKSDIKGPLNILLVGIDPRASQNKNDPPRSDSIMIMHISEDLQSGYVFSMPRDLLVQIPPFPKAGFRGTGSAKINEAMEKGSIVPGKTPDPVRGFELLSNTITTYTGITRFDAGAIIDFGGFEKIVDAMGGVDMYLDSDVKSDHRKPDGGFRPGAPKGSNDFDGYVGPQATYKKGQAHLRGWQALDYVRQRHGLPNSDYDRQRHQQQFLKAMVNQALSKDMVTNLPRLDSVLRAAGESLIFNGRGIKVADFAFALRGIRSDSIQMIKLPGEPVGAGAAYQGERLKPPAKDFFASVQANTVDAFMLAHPEFINKDK